MRFQMRSLLSLPFAFSLWGCAQIPSGPFMVQRVYTERSFDLIGNRAAFELHCPKEQIHLVTLNVMKDFGGDIPTQVGAEGCGQRAVYISVRNQGWIMNTSTEQNRPSETADRSGGGRG